MPIVKQTRRSPIKYTEQQLKSFYFQFTGEKTEAFAERVNIRIHSAMKAIDMGIRNNWPRKKDMK